MRPRGIEASRLLQSFGRVFREGPEESFRDFRLQSIPRDSIDIFLSHVWSSNPRIRFFGLLWYNNSTIAALSSLIVTGVISVILASVIDGRYWVWFEAKFLLTIHSLTALVGTAILLLLMFSVHKLKGILRFRDSVFFMDRCCIEQVNHSVKISEIRQIPDIITKSDTMLILLTETYFKRLWCCYEMAVYVSDARRLKAQIPILLPLRLVMITLLLVIVDLLYVILIRSNLRTVGQLDQQVSTRSLLFRIFTCIYSVVVAGLCLWFASMWNTENMKHTQVLRSFSLSKVDCSDVADRDVLIADISSRFGSVGKFEAFVRNDMLHLVNKMNTPRIKFLLFAGLPQLFSMFGYFNVLTQRIGLFCMSSLDMGFVPKDDSFCVVLDREIWANALVILSQLVRYICFYPVVFSLLLMGCEFIRRRFTQSRVSVILSFGVLFVFTSAYIIVSNWKFSEEQTLISQCVDAGVLLSIFCIFLFFPKLSSNYVA